ncbi:hypothetical protein QN277_022779 [Acacia crassicarpa]|uniref:Uncharacterized protein n=1 Tax=Acacia crassicarpa TaxID=499986 RepID=A0AAE1MLC9_9FABA|nr:hypothetical protein QN277_022779 [Acacia crassicarpa]
MQGSEAEDANNRNLTGDSTEESPSLCATRVGSEAGRRRERLMHRVGAQFEYEGTQRFCHAVCWLLGGHLGQKGTLEEDSMGAQTMLRLAICGECEAEE